MLNTKQRWIVFAILCLITVGAFAFEGFLLYSLIDKEPSVAQALMAVANTGLLYAVARQFIEISRKTFVQRSIMPVDRWQGFASERNRIIAIAQPENSDPFQTRQRLVTNTLKFAEETLKGWLPGSHFELCVFVDQEEPFLFGYFDSNRDTTARSMAHRNRNPHFYVEKGYEVTKILRNPTSHPRVLKDTHDSKTSYTFTTEEQKKQIRSSVLLCLDLNTPCALVISSNEQNAFPKTDPEVMSFVRLIGELVRYDLFEGGFVHGIREMRPQMFNTPPGMMIAHAEQDLVVAPETGSVVVGSPHS